MQRSVSSTLEKLKGKSKIIIFLLLLFLPSAKGELEIYHPEKVENYAEIFLKVRNNDEFLIYPSCRIKVADQNIDFQEIPLDSGEEAIFGVSIFLEKGEYLLKASCDEAEKESKIFADGKMTDLVEREEGEIIFLSGPVLEEVLVNETIVVSITIENRGGKKEIKPEIDGIPYGWITSRRIVVDKGERATLNIPITVPKGEEPTEIPLKLKIGDSTYPFLFRIKQAVDFPIITRLIKFDLENRKTIFLLRIKNFKEYLEIVEVEDGGVERRENFNIVPLHSDGTARWKIFGLDPKGEKMRSIDYEVSGILPSEKLLYDLYWKIVSYPEPEEVVKSRWELPTFYPGKTSPAKLTISNRDSKQKILWIRIDGPSGWIIDPPIIAYLPPRANKSFFLNITPPEIDSGFYTLHAEIGYEGKNFTSELSAWVGSVQEFPGWIFLLLLLPIPLILFLYLRRRMEEARRRARIRILRRMK